MRTLKLIGAAVLVLVLATLGSVYGLLRASLPQLDGRIEHRTLLRARCRHHGARHRAETEQPGAAVLLERCLAEELRQFARGEPPRQVHLEKTVLRVHESAGEGEIEPVGCFDGRHPARIAP